MDAGVATAADSNKVAAVGVTWPPMMDRKRVPVAPRPATHLAEAAIPHPDAFAMAAEEPPIEPVSRVAAPAEAPGRNRTVPADATPEVALPLASGFRSKFRYLLNGRHASSRNELRPRVTAILENELALPLRHSLYRTGRQFCNRLLQN